MMIHQHKDHQSHILAYLIAGDLEGINLDVSTHNNASLHSHGHGHTAVYHKRESLKEEYRVTITSVIVCIILFTTLGNLATIVAVRGDRRLRSVSNLYLASLAVADLFVGSFVMVFMLLYTVTFDGIWVFGHVVCDIWNFVDYVACTASLTNVCAIAVDRYQTVSEPLRAIHRRTKKRAIRIILTAWSIPIVSWLVIILTLRLQNGRPPDGHCYLQWAPPVTALIVASAFVYMPLTLIIVLFVTIMHLLKQHMTGMSDHFSRAASSRNEPRFESYCDNSSQLGGGISFNAQFPVETMGSSLMSADSTKSIPMLPLASHIQTTTDSFTGCAPSTLQFVSESVQTMDMCHDFEHYHDGKTFRSIGTNTSPERYGLVRSIATNTSPSLSHRCSSLQNLPNVTEIESIHGSMSTLPSVGDSSTDLKSDSDGDTVRTFSSSISHECQSDSDGSIPMGTPRWRRRYASLLRARRESSLERSRLKQQLKAAKTLGIIMTFLLLCWLPFAIMWPIKTFCPDCVLQRTLDISIWTNYLNSSINPVIYCLCNPNFRRAFKRIFTRR